MLWGKGKEGGRGIMVTGQCRLEIKWNGAEHFWLEQSNGWKIWNMSHFESERQRNKSKSPSWTAVNKMLKHKMVFKCFKCECLAVSGQVSIKVQAQSMEIVEYHNLCILYNILYMPQMLWMELSLNLKHCFKHRWNYITWLTGISVLIFARRSLYTSSTYCLSLLYPFKSRTHKPQALKSTHLLFPSVSGLCPHICLSTVAHGN